MILTLRGCKPSAFLSLSSAPAAIPVTVEEPRSIGTLSGSMCRRVAMTLSLCVTKSPSENVEGERPNHSLIAPKVNPLTRCRWMTRAKTTTGKTAKVPDAASEPQLIAEYEMKL